MRTKYQGELAVLSEFPEATIFRCADVYGGNDNFINFWFSRWRKTFKREISLWKRGVLDGFGIASQNRLEYLNFKRPNPTGTKKIH